MNYIIDRSSSIGQFLFILFIALFSGVFGGAVVWGVYHFGNGANLVPEMTATPTAITGQTGSSLRTSGVSAAVDGSRQNAIVQAADIAGKAVVTVNAYQTVVVRQFDPLYDEFFGNFFNMLPYRQERVPSMGSGFIINKDGYVLTNHHVIDQADEIYITLSDGRELPAKLAGSDPSNDIAVLKVAGDNLPVILLGNSDDLIIGEWAIAIGNPFGNMINDPRPTVTVGVISAIGRDFRPKSSDDKSYRGMIQTDAAINPGNSGGPLVNNRGEVIGMNTFIFSKSGGNVGIGFAIPINHVKRVFDEIVRYGSIRDVWIGLEIHGIAPAVARYFKLTDRRGLIVTRVEKGSSADEAGFQVYDIIRTIDGVAVASYSEADAAFTGKHVGETVTCQVERDGEKSEIVMRLKSLPNNLRR